jgi:hypothetical protein
MGKRTLLRAGVLVAAAAGFCLAFSLSASADVVEPQSATQPAAAGLLQEETAAAMVPEGIPDGKPADVSGGDPKAAATQEELSEVVEPTPAPEQVVRQAPARVVHASTDTNPAPSVVDRVMHPLRMGFQHIGASLGRVVGACDVGFGPGAGGPVLVLAVMSMAAPLIRRRVFMSRWTADEDVPEFLFARELTPPG